MTLKVLTVVGARPQFVKAAMLSRALRAAPGVHEVMVHTGQHFDANMSDVFFDELDMAPPAHHLGIGGGSHAENTGRMLEALERVILDEQPDWVVVFGDTDSTLAGAVAAIKRHFRIAHVEAGLRSRNRRMPEEINRVLTDHASTLLFAPTRAAVDNLRLEGLDGDRVELVGDIMYDAALYFGDKADRESKVLERVGVRSKEYALLTVHRPANTDDPEQLGHILTGLAASPRPVVWPLHPRTRGKIAQFGKQMPPQVRVIDPVGYLDMVMLERHALLIATDSGGVQKEAYFHGVPCVTLREETEWVELVDCGANQLIGTDAGRLALALREPPRFPGAAAKTKLYGDGSSADRMVRALERRRDAAC